MPAGSLYDHIMAIVIVGVIFVSSITAVTTLNFNRLLYNDEQQLIQLATNVMNSILLDPGDPPNWGLDYIVDEENVRVLLSEDEISRFGLALSESSSLYVLDPNKIAWLVGDTPYGEGLELISYERVRELLGLQGYGFRIRIFSPLIVSITGLEGKLNQTLDHSGTINLSFSVSVKHYDDLSPVPNAKVTAIVLYSKKEGNTFITYTGPPSANFTDEFGECTITDLAVDCPVSFIVAILQVNVANLSTVSTFYAGTPPGYAAGINILEEYLILTHPKDIGNPNEARFIQNICLLKRNGELVVVYNSTGSNDILNWGSYDNWVRWIEELGDKDVSLIIVTISALDPSGGGAGGRRKGVLIVGPYPVCFGSRVISYGGVPYGSSAKVFRTVEINNEVYIFELTLWRE